MPCVPDVFLNTCAADAMRVGMLRLTTTWWTRQHDLGRCRVHVVDVRKNQDSQRARHIHAARQAQSPWYVVADDDILPSAVTVDGRCWVEAVDDFMASHPAYGLVQPFLWPRMSGPSATHMVVPRRAVGGLRVVRAGAILPGDLPLNPGNGPYDVVLTNCTRGLTGELQTWTALHLGDASITGKGRPGPQAELPYSASVSNPAV